MATFSESNEYLPYPLINSTRFETTSLVFFTESINYSNTLEQPVKFERASQVFFSESIEYDNGLVVGERYSLLSPTPNWQPSTEFVITLSQLDESDDCLVFSPDLAEEFQEKYAIVATKRYGFEPWPVEFEVIPKIY